MRLQMFINKSVYLRIKPKFINVFVLNTMPPSYKLTILLRITTYRTCICQTFKVLTHRFLLYHYLFLSRVLVMYWLSSWVKLSCCSLVLSVLLVPEDCFVCCNRPLNSHSQRVPLGLSKCFPGPKPIVSELSEQVTIFLLS